MEAYCLDPLGEMHLLLIIMLYNPEWLFEIPVMSFSIESRSCYTLCSVCCVLCGCSSFQVALPLRRARMTRLVGCLTFALTRRLACTHTTTSYVASRQWRSQRAAGSWWEVTMTSTVMCGTHWNRIEQVIVNYIQFHTRVNIWLTASASGLLNPMVAS